MNEKQVALAIKEQDYEKRRGDKFEKNFINNKFVIISCVFK